MTIPITLLLIGNCEQGYLLQLQGTATATLHSDACPQLQTLYQQWLQHYTGLCRDLRIKVSANQTTILRRSSTSEQCAQAWQQLEQQLGLWLGAVPRLQVELLRELGGRHQPVRLWIRSDDPLVWKMPWASWSPLAEQTNLSICLGPLHPCSSAGPTRLVLPYRILVLFGDTTGLSVAEEKQAFQQMQDSGTVAIRLLPNATRSDLQALRRNWDIVYFAGHSETRPDGQGCLRLADGDVLTTAEVRDTFRQSIEGGLQLAIFNSCNGLGLANDLSALGVPQVLVMREPVPDAVAAVFLRALLSELLLGQPCDVATRRAQNYLRENLALQVAAIDAPPLLESVLPGVTTLPVLWLNTPEASRSPLVLPVSAGMWRPSRQLGLASVLVVAALVALVRGLGGWVPWESAWVDQMLRWRPAEPTDPRLLLVVGYPEEQDAAELNASQGNSLSDARLARLIAALQRHRPALLALDLYREHAARDRHLAEALGRDGRIIGICKQSDPAADNGGIAPPPELAAQVSTHVGFSDILPDEDGVLRRQLLALAPLPNSPCAADRSFSHQVAFNYLHEQSVPLVEHWSSGDVRLGGTRLPFLVPGFTAFPRFAGEGFELWLNYRAGAQPFAVCSATTVLADNCPSGQIQDRIVLIGVQNREGKDRHRTPLQTPSSATGETTGLEVQGHMVSQLLGAALDGRVLLRTPPAWVEFCLWFLAAAVGQAGSLLLGWRRGSVLASSALLIAGMGVWAFRGPGWVLPVVPMLAALLLCGLAVPWVGRLIVRRYLWRTSTERAEAWKLPL